MTSQHQIELLRAEILNPRRIMHQNNIACRRVWFHGSDTRIQTSSSKDLKLAINRRLLLFHQPAASGRSKTLLNPVKRRFAPIVVIARNAIKWRFDFGEDL